MLLCISNKVISTQQCILTIHHHIHTLVLFGGSGLVPTTPAKSGADLAGVVGPEIDLENSDYR